MTTETSELIGGWELLASLVIALISAAVSRLGYPRLWGILAGVSMSIVALYFVQRRRRSSDQASDVLSEEWSAPQYEAHWGAVLGHMFRKMSGDLRDIADDVDEEPADELREIATAIEEAADHYDRGTTEQ